MNFYCPNLFKYYSLPFQYITYGTPSEVIGLYPPYENLITQNNSPTQSLICPKNQLVRPEQTGRDENSIDHSFDEARQIKNLILKSLKKKEKKLKITKPPKTPVNQNPHRNIYTNLGNQIITFLYLRKKSYQVLKLIFPNLTVEQQNKYYQFAYQMKKSVNGYINHSKLKRIWQRDDLKEHQIFYQSILRTMSYYYLNHMVIPAILTSKKMSKETLYEHLIVRRILLKTVEGEQYC